MLDHWWLIRARISFLSSQPVLAIHWLGHPRLGSWEEGERRSIPTSVSNPPTWKHTDVLILQLPAVPQKHGEATRAPVTAGCLPGVRRPGVCPAGSPRRQTISDSQTMLGAGRPFPAPAPARRKAPARDRPYLGRNTAPPRAGSHSLPRRQQRGLGLPGVLGPLFVPIAALRTPAVGTAQEDTEHVQCQTPQEGKCPNPDSETQTNQTWTPRNNPLADSRAA